MNNKMRWIPLLLVFTLLTVWRPSFAQEKFPSKPITIICPWSPGAGADLIARLVQKHAEKHLNQPIVVQNKPGGAGTIGFTAGMNARADGYTLTEVTPSVVITPYTVPQTPEYIKKFEAIILTATSPMAITVREDSPWKTFKELIDFAKSNPRKVRISNSGHAAIFHVAAIGVEVSAGVKFTHVPFKGSAPGVLALAGGHVDASCTTVAAVMQLAKSRRLRILAICSDERRPDFPQVPTFKEVGIDLFVNSWYGFLTPKGTPKKNIKIIHDAFRKAIETSEFKEGAKSRGLVFMYRGPEDFDRFLEDMDKQWYKLIEFGGLKIAK
ncbi:tripartite tricarboxylate transporter substrate binding protein [Thermodesulfobacteriota bacterium]